MSVKVPSPMVSYQSHNHCQCDFCCSRRAVNAKKWAVSQYARQLRHAKQLHGQPCETVSGADAADFARTHGMTTTFDPNYPEPVDQMARNAQRGRGTTGAAAGQSLSPSQQRDADEAATLRDLDKLERLLMLEHKARVQAALEADKLATLRQTGRAPALQPLPPGGGGSADGYTPTSDKDNNNNSNGVSEHNSDGDNMDQDDIHDAFVRAHHCPVPPPAQCAASARLQDTLNDLRLVTMDPANAQNRSTLQRVLEVQAREDALARGEADAAAASGGALGGNLPCAGYAYATRAIRRAKEEQRRAAEAQQQGARARAANGYGETLADIRTSAIHPQGAGVVWRHTAAQAPLTASQTTATSKNNTQRQTTPLPPGAAAALAMQQSNAAVSTRSLHA